MKQLNQTIAVAALVVITSSPTIADETKGFYSGAGAGYVAPGELNLFPTSIGEKPLSAFGGLRFNRFLGLEGFYSDINPTNILSSSGGNLYTQSFLGSGLSDNTYSNVAGMSLVFTLSEDGPIRPFARAGVHHYKLVDGAGLENSGDNLLFGAGADLKLNKDWSARLEWEHYNDVEYFDRDIFSATFEFRF